MLQILKFSFDAEISKIKESEIPNQTLKYSKVLLCLHSLQTVNC